MTALPRTALVAASLFAAPAAADGVYAMFNDYGDPLGDFVVMGDVYTDDGRELVWIEMPTMEMWLYLPPEAVYVTIDASNPVIRNQIPFYGEWVSYSPNAQGCGGGIALDHNGMKRTDFGEVIMTNTGLADYEVLFELDASYCDGPMEFFAYYDPAAGMPQGGGGSVKGGQTHIITK